MPAESALKQKHVSLDDFEAMLADMPPDGRWELIGGRVVKGMVGARWEHHRIIRRLDYLLQRHFDETGRPCSTFTETFYLKDPALDLSALPDLMVRCGPLPPDATFLSDPIVAVEVLSPGTEQRDRLDKSTQYRLLASLRHYVLVDRDRVRVESTDRTATGWAALGPLTSPDDTLRLGTLDFAVPLAEIYRDAIG